MGSMTMALEAPASSVAVRRGLGDRVHADGAARAVLDHEALAQLVAHGLADRSRQHVDEAPGNVCTMTLTGLG